MLARIAKAVAAAFLAAALVASSATAQTASGDGVVRVKSAYPLDETVARLKKDIAAKGIRFDLPEDDGWCDLVLLRGSLQHLDRPIETLARCHDWLRPGGWLVALATPNAGGLVYRLFQDLPPLDPPRNFVVFSDRVLRQCLLNLGYRDVEFVYPYRGTPYAAPVRDHFRFLLRLAGVKRPFAFWRNMMECYARH